LSKAVVALLLIGVVLGLLLKRISLLQQPVDFVRGFFWIMALVFLLSPVQNPWYLCWIVPFLCIFPQRSLLALTGLVGFYYLDFYFDYQELQIYSQWIPWVEYLPFYFLLTLELWKSRKQLRRTRSIKEER
jgi:glycerol-3-phosphate acyltransferase PlsY